MTITDRGIVATSQTLASQAGAQVLARGGSAMDAAIAANAVLGVVEPESCGMGGDLFAIYWDAKTGKLTAINSSGWAPTGLTIDFLKGIGEKGMPQEGIHSVTVPGCVEGWSKLHKKFGKLPWSDLFQPAIYYAEHGFPVTEMIGAAWKTEEAKLSKERNAAKILLRDGKAPNIGDVFKNPQMASALKLVAGQGAPAFYRGAIAQAILKTSQRLGGQMTAADLSEFEAEWVTPLSTEYHGWKVYELPPSGQGIAALQMLNILSLFPLASYPARGVQELHTQIEAQKLAYADLHHFVADMRFAKVPVEGMLSMEYARERAKLIDPDKARCEDTPGNPTTMAGDTIYLSVVDRDGNIVSLIQSVYQHFGSGVVVDDYGFALQNRGGLFEVDPHHPNALMPRKRPFHTIIPAFMEKGDIHMGFGIMGGLNQAQAHAQFVSNIVDHGMNIQTALEVPRFTRKVFGGCETMIENRIPAAVRDGLTAKGHQLKVTGDFSSDMGGGQVVVHNTATQVNWGASSPRKDGAAIPEPHPYWGK
ncbi:MAG TPA: gamma-glutamyltransferase [Candidatus Sulfopaludibacter sp.]|jgi:gamma-glutamyltranspeptidase/glutathione hydrolase|nr:gamma-glutamyltransferase [Candidatus Sulfopaludibacter sp.]